MDVQINYLAVLLAGISSMVVGAIWYSPPVFGKVWGSWVKRDHAQEKREMPLVMGLTLLSSLIMAFVLAHLVFISHRFFGNSLLQDSMSTAFWVWIGFSVQGVVTGGLFEQRRKKAIVLQLANLLVTLEVMALIIGALKP